jgi:hypothetical protein
MPSSVMLLPKSTFEAGRVSGFKFGEKILMRRLFSEILVDPLSRGVFCQQPQEVAVRSVPDRRSENRYRPFPADFAKAVRGPSSRDKMDMKRFPLWNRHLSLPAYFSDPRDNPMKHRMTT